MKNLTLSAATLIALAAPSLATDLTVTVSGTVTIDAYGFGPYASANIGDTVTVSFDVSVPGTDVIPGQETNYAVNSASFAVDINGPLSGTPVGAPNMTIENDNPADALGLVTSLTNGDVFGCEFDALASFFSSTDLHLLGGTYNNSALTGQNCRFSGAGGFLGFTLNTLDIQFPPPGYCVELIGTVTQNSYSSGLFGGVNSGDIAVLRYCVSVPGMDIAPGQLTNYAIELASFRLDINGSTGAALAGPTNLQIQNNFPASDGFRINQTQLATGQFFESGFGAVGSLFPSTDITQLGGTYDVAANLTSFGYTIQGGGGFLEIFPDTLIITTPNFGTNYCIATANSTGNPGVMSALGSSSISANDLTLVASQIPNTPGFGIFIAGPTQASIPLGNGNLCISLAGLQRITQVTAPVGGTVTQLIDYTGVSTGTASLNVVAGQPFNFQYWFRDPGAGVGAVNFTDGLSLDMSL